MTHLAGAVTLVIVLLLASVSTASAECAWVLWQEITARRLGSSSVVWDLMQADTTKDACHEALEGKVRDVARLPIPHIRFEGNIVVSGYSPQVTITRFFCLPDTIDPRGPKGK